MPCRNARYPDRAVLVDAAPRDAAVERIVIAHVQRGDVGSELVVPLTGLKLLP